MPDTIDNPQADLDARNKSTSKWLIGIIIGSFILAFASIPLYRIVCQSIDPGGSSWQNGSIDDYGDTTVDDTRTIEVQFATNVVNQLPWRFETPPEGSVELHPGERKTVTFRAQNMDSGEITGKAVYDINPPEAGKYFKKLECFCFVEQTLAGGEGADMPLVFWFDPEMPEHVTQITVAYTFFNADTSLERSRKKREARR